MRASSLNGVSSTLASAGRVIAQGREDEHPKPRPMVPAHRRAEPDGALAELVYSANWCITTDEPSMRIASNANAGKPDEHIDETSAQSTRPAQIMVQ